ncbi:MAG: RluA family pseudouridine synthase [Epulopiscium sp.]|nr:RluA family pseudouridine synthase [Candidatus Epulonipiscium sp.]
MKKDYKWEFDYFIEEIDVGQRIDKFLVDKLKNYTRSAIQREIKSGNILVNDSRVKPNYTLTYKDIIKGFIPAKEEVTILAEKMDIKVMYEDDHIAVINKDANLVVHPSPNNYSGTLVNGLLYHYQDNLSTCAGKLRPGIVHRLDKDTTGLIIIAKNNLAHERLAEMMLNYEVTRKYHAIVYGNFTDEEGRIDQPIGRHPTDRTTMTVRYDNSREALTSYKVLKQYEGFSYIELTLHTGRTHQLRVHMKHIGHPILGDLVYGPKKQAFSKTGQLLHAKILEFNHPITNEAMQFDCPLPSYFARTIDNIKKHNN